MARRRHRGGSDARRPSPTRLADLGRDRARRNHSRSGPACNRDAARRRARRRGRRPIAASHRRRAGASV
ncbi:hypothetical protein ACFPRL_11235 [Pseudoclavibacter helvolus]